MSFPDGFVVFARNGTVIHRYVAQSLADALAWKASKEDLGFTVGEPAAHVAWRDNVRVLGHKKETA